MIIRINTRTNGDQLADYVASFKGNDHVEILEVDGREDADKDYLKQTIISMELNGQLTKCKNPFLNVQINPAYGEDQEMTREDWYRAADILAEELGYQDQRRVIVLHTKKGRTHAHVIWERYNHETQKVVPTKNSRLKAKFARVRMEKEFGHKRTAWRNDKQTIKDDMTQLWNETQTGAEFVKQAKKAGYIISTGTGNRPFMVVDQNGVSCDLVRQIQDVRTKEVRARLRNEQLMTDKEAIEMVRSAQATNSGKRGREQPEAKPSANAKAKAFDENVQQILTDENKIRNDRFDRFNDFHQSVQDSVTDNRGPEQTPAEKAASNFADNKPEIIKDEISEQEHLREQIRLQQEYIRKRRKAHRR
jgi:hypothetical protein